MGFFQDMGRGIAAGRAVAADREADLATQYAADQRARAETEALANLKAQQAQREVYRRQQGTYQPSISADIGEVSDPNAYKPTSGAFNPAARTKRETGSAGKTELPKDRSIEISEASNRLQAKKRADTQAARDRRTMQEGPAAMSDVLASPFNAAWNLGQGAFAVGKDVINRAANMALGKDVYNTDNRGNYVSMTPLTDEYIRKPVQGMADDAATLKRLQAEDAARINAQSGQAPAAQGANAPLSVRNNNPGNLKYAGQPGATADARGFAVFATPEAGAAAAERQLQIYMTQGALTPQGRTPPLNTIRAIVGAWSPRSDPGNAPGSTDNYINFVAQKLGISPDQPVTPDMASRILQAMAPFEAGTGQGQPQAPAQPGAQPQAAAPQPQYNLPPLQPIDDQKFAFAQSQLARIDSLMQATRDVGQLERLQSARDTLVGQLQGMAVDRAFYSAQAGDLRALGGLASMMQIDAGRLPDGRIILRDRAGAQTVGTPQQVAQTLRARYVEQQRGAQFAELDRKHQHAMELEKLKSLTAQQLEALKQDYVIAGKITEAQAEAMIKAGQVQGSRTLDDGRTTIVFNDGRSVVVERVTDKTGTRWVSTPAQPS